MEQLHPQSAGLSLESGRQLPLLSINKLSLNYENHIALNNLVLHIQKGSLTSIIGPNGGGKSTFLKVIMGVISPSKGHITRHLPMKKIAYLPQQSEVDRTFPITIYDMVAMGLWSQIGPFKAYPCSAHDNITDALKEIGLLSYADAPLSALSGGQMQRVLFARLSLQNADLILLDEPFNNLDQLTIEDLIQMILKWHQQGKTVIAVLHDLDLVRAHFPECILLARDLIAKGSMEEVMTVENISLSYIHARRWQSP